MIRTGFLLAGVLLIAACSSSGDRNRLYYGNSSAQRVSTPAAVQQPTAPIYVTPYRAPLASQPQPATAQPAVAQSTTTTATRPVSRRTTSNATAPQPKPEVVTRAAYSFASGPISNACLSANRKSANKRLCGCVQSVANRSLSSGDQRLAATFFANPHRAQEVRQSDSPTKEAFWKRYKTFAKSAEGTCKGL